MTLRAFLEALPLPVIGIDQGGRVDLWNAEAERLLGWLAAEVTGKPDPSLGPGGRRCRRDGTPLELSVMTATAALSEQEPPLILSFLHDLTEQLALRNDQFRLMLEQLPAILCTYDPDLVFTSVQGAGLRALGLDSDAFIGRRLSEIVGEAGAPVQSVLAALRGESSTNEYLYLGRWYANRAEPLRNRDGTIAGAINLGFDITERRKAEHELVDSREQLRRFSTAMHKIHEDERRSIARELHDGLGQLLTSLRLDLGIMRRDLRTVPTAALERKIAAMLDLVDLTIQTVRRVSKELRPLALDDLGLRAALEHEATAFTGRTGIDIELRIHGDDLIDTDHATAIYRIVQEGLTNVARHSGASRVDVRIEAGEERIEVELHDNGRGITEEEVNNASALGLIGVRERAYALGGEAVIAAVPGDGTRIFVSLPL